MIPMTFSKTGLPAIVPPVFFTEKGTPYFKEAGVAMLVRPHTDLTTVRDFLGQFDGSLGFGDYFDDPVPLPEAEAIVKFAGQLCYESFGPGHTPNAKVNDYIGNILASSHGSLLEHATFGFLIWGIDRAVTHELVRHRAGTAFCLAGDTEIYSGSKCNGRFDGVKRKWTIERLYQMSQDPRRKGRIKLMTVRCFDGQKFVPASIKSVFRSGEKPIFRMILSDGKSIRASATHPFKTIEGWKTIEQLSIGEPIATNGLAAIVIDPEWLYRRYRVDNALIQEIADEAGCSPHTIRKYIRIHGFQKEQGQGQKGRNPPNKGKRYKNGPRFSEEEKRKISERMTGPGNHRWQGDQASQGAGRMRAWKKFPSQPCESCGEKEGHRHHKDRNTLNNDRDNIEFLCGSCHARRHFKEDGPSNALTIKWVSIVSIEPDGFEETYDIEVDHPEHNFVANGIVTHNSQVSQRYVDGSRLRFVQRPEYQLERITDWAATFGEHEEEAHREMRSLFHAFIKSIDDAREEYDANANRLIRLRELGHPMLKGASRTDIRKQVNQAARERLPNATEAPIYMTGNVRAWRHILEQRDSPAADVTIREMMHKIYRCLSHTAPVLFGDYSVVEVSASSTQAVTTLNRKV